MNWFDGSITDAIKLAKERNAFFVVYIKGSDETLENWLSEENTACLQSEKFVSIKILSNTDDYHQFSQIYKVDTLPALFVIGENGKIVKKFAEDELNYSGKIASSLMEMIYGKNKVLDSRPKSVVLTNSNSSTIIPNISQKSASEKKGNQLNAEEIEKSTTKILFKTPSGESFKENFNNNDTFETLLNYVRNKMLVESRNIVVLSTVFPKYEFDSGDYSKTLKELNLCRSAVIYVKVKAAADNSMNKFSPFNFLYYLVNSFIEIVANLFTNLKGRFTSNSNDSNNADIQRRDKILKRFEGQSSSSTTTTNIRTLHDSKKKDDPDDNNTYNGNSTQQM